jgi:CRISPR system Cascade subunit CasC
MKKLIELHVLQPIVNGGVNRDENGAIKTTHLGGKARLRISSQAWKRAIRDVAKKIDPELFGGIRTRYLPKLVSDALIDSGVNDDGTIAANVSTILANGSIDKKNSDRVTGLIYISTGELAHIAAGIASSKYLAKKLAVKKPSKTDKNSVLELWEESLITADQALFGRMVADSPGCNIVAASQYSHAVGVDLLELDFDYYSAMDDLQPEDVSGAGFTGLREIGSSLVYRYAALDLGQLATNLGNDASMNDAVIKTWIQSTIVAIPGGNRAGQNTDTYPLHVVVVTQDGVRGASAAGAFIDPVKASNQGLSGVAIKRLDEHLADMKRFAIGEMNIRTMCADESLENFVATVVGV